MPAISSYAVTSRTASAFRDLNKFGTNVADYVSISADKTYSGFGNGTGYTVSSWISDGAFADLAAVQAVYPICQGTSDTVDWVLLQTAIDDTIYGNLGNSNYGLTKATLLIPAGKYVCNRSLHIGYGRAGTPPAALNGNGYVSLILRGEGHQVDSSGNGMTGVTIQFTSQVGIVSTLGQDVQIEEITILGPHLSWISTNNSATLSGSAPGNTDNWKPTGISSDNWLGGAAVSIGIGCDLYASVGSAAAYPARPLPASFGGGTTVAVTGGGSSGTGVWLKNVNIAGFIIGWGHPHGDANGEFLRHDGGTISYCVYCFVSGHSQARNNSLSNVNCYIFHTMLSATGGTQSNANHHGGYYNIHAGYGYQIINHANADWSGVLTIRDLYSEGTHRIGNWNGVVKFDGGYFSFYEQGGTFGVPPHHFDISHLILDGTGVGGLRHGLISASANTNKLDIFGGTGISADRNPNWQSHTNAAKIRRGLDYMGTVLSFPGFNQRRFSGDGQKSRFGYNNDATAGNYQDVYGSQTYLDQEFVDFNAIHPLADGVVGTLSDQMMGPTHRFAVPKITYQGKRIDFISRSGLDIVCDRVSLGSIKLDVGDYMFAKPYGVTESLRVNTWFVVVDATSAEITIRQQTNYFGTTQYDYQTNGNYQFNPSTGEGVSGSAPGYGVFTIFCTRVRQHRCLWVGDVTSGSAVISNVKNALAYGSVDDFVTGNFYAAVGDYHLHTEIERANTGGSGLTVQNKITAIDFTANTITLTENFNITKTNYPIVFYVETYNA